MKSRNTLRNPIRVMLILTAFVVVAGIVISWDTDEFTLQTAVGQTNDTLETSEDFLHLERANRAFINLVKRTRPAVVQITTQTRRNRIVTSQRNQLTPEQEREFRRFFGDEFPFRRFFEEPERIPNPMPSRGVGSGVIVSDDGYILTNNHVIEGTDAIKVTLSNGKEYDAELVGRDDAQSEVGGSDLAVIKIDAEALPVLPFGDSDALEVGEWVIAIGTPLNYSQSVTRGIVSAKGRTGFTIYGQFIQTDAPINQGNSGGALINIRGELVGINTLIATNSLARGNIGIGFSIPSNLAQQILPQLIENGKVERGWLGINMDTDPVSAELAEELNLGTPRGVLVKVVGPKSPAQKAGIQRGDVIVTFDGQQVQDWHHLRHIVGATRVGKSVEVTVIRKGGEEKRLTVKLGRRTQETLASLSPDEERPIIVKQADEEEGALAGLQVQELTPEMAERYGYASGEKGVIVIQVERGSNAEKEGIKPGYLIQELEWMPVDDLESYARIAEQLKAQHKRRVLLYVRLPDNRGGDYVTLGTRRTSDR